jgi:hypothetical protein
MYTHGDMGLGERAEGSLSCIPVLEKESEFPFVQIIYHFDFSRHILYIKIYIYV